MAASVDEFKKGDIVTIGPNEDYAPEGLAVVVGIDYHWQGDSIMFVKEGEPEDFEPLYAAPEYVTKIEEDN